MVAFGCGDSPIEVEIPPIPSFSLVVSSGITVERGDSATAKVTVARNHFTGSITLTVVGVPAGMNVAFFPPIVGGTEATIMVTVAEETVAGQYVLTISGNGVGVEGQNVTLSVTVPPVTFVSLFIDGDSIVKPPAILQLNAVAEYSDGTTSVLPHDQVVWTYDDYNVGWVNSVGVVIPHILGSLQVCVSYHNLQGCRQIEIVGTSRSELPEISDEGWNLVMGRDSTVSHGFRNSDGALYRQNITPPLSLWAEEGIPVENIVEAIAFWATDSDGKIQFVQVPDSVGARIKMYFDLEGTIGVCAWGGISGHISINPTNPHCVRKETLAHELGRTLGFGTFPDNTDIMSTPSVWKSHPLRVEVLKWVYHDEVKPGMILIDG